jgi:sodium pump decarboxylase gamma subunit
MSDLAWGLQMTVLGMGLVFALLTLLWGLLTLMQRLDRQPPVAALPAQAQAAAALEATPANAQAAAVASVQGMDAELMAAILVATLAHRAARRREAAPAMRRSAPGSQLHTSRWVGAGRVRQNHSWQRRGR